MNYTYVDIIKTALEAIEYSDERDNNKLRAAVQDLSGKYTNECKFFLRSADDRFLAICSKALNGEQIPLYKTQASEYLQSEYYTDRMQADALSNITIRAFALYGGNSIDSLNIEKVTKEHNMDITTNGESIDTPQVKPHKSKSVNKSTDVQSSDINPVHSRTTTTLSNVLSRLTRQGKLANKLQTRGKGKYIVLIAILSIILCVTIFLPINRIDIEGVVDGVVLYNVGDSISIHVRSVSLRDLSYGFICDENIDVDFELEQYAGVFIDAYFTITRINPGKTDLTIFAIDAESGEEIESITPAVLEVDESFY